MDKLFLGCFKWLFVTSTAHWQVLTPKCNARKKAEDQNMHPSFAHGRNVSEVLLNQSRDTVGPAHLAKRRSRSRP